MVDTDYPLLEPAHEARRLAALERLEVLDSEPEATFEAVVAALAAALDAPIALITLVDRERCWYKAELGMGVSEMPRADNMCDAVLQLDDVYVVPDARAATGLVTAPLRRKGLRAYIGAPLRSREGVPIGTLCAVDTRPRDVTARETGIVSALAAVVSDALELRLHARRMAQAEESLRELNRRLAAANENKSAFLASMSHELRTPLNGILGASELLGAGLFGDLNAKQAEYVHDIHQSGTHLLSLINDILDLSRIEAGQTELDREPLDVGRLMESSAAVVRGIATAKSLALDVVPPPEPIAVLVDERRIKQVACNLLSNAVKFAPEHGHVRFLARRAGGEVVFSVEDDGPGVPPAHRERIFEQFFRLPSDQEGTGLGLTVAKQLVELHGGRIWLDAGTGRGSRFCFSVPLEAPR